MARGTTQQIVRKGGEDRGADGRPSKQARTSALQQVLKTNREKIEEEETANAARREEKKRTEIGCSILAAVCIDVEDRPSDRHNAVVQTTYGCCIVLYDMVVFMDRYCLTTMSEVDM